MGNEYEKLRGQMTTEQLDRFETTARDLAAFSGLPETTAAVSLAKAINDSGLGAAEGVYQASRKVRGLTHPAVGAGDVSWLDAIPQVWRTCCQTMVGAYHLSGCSVAVKRSGVSVPSATFEPSEFPQFPHCDPSILHAPGACRFCDEHRDWQVYRDMAGINFTGEHAEHKAPCPSEWLRSAEVRDRWPGNVAAPEGQPAPSFWPPELLEAINLGAEHPGAYRLGRGWLEESLRFAGVPEHEIRSDYGTGEDQRAYAAAASRPRRPWYTRLRDWLNR